MNRGYHNKKKKKGNAAKVAMVETDNTSTAIPRESATEPKYEGPAVYKPPDSNVAVWTLVTAVIVASVYGLQLRAMLESNRISRSTMVIGQRAFVSFTGNLDARPGIDSKTRKADRLVTPHYKNSGNTAALNVHAYVNINAPDYKALPPGYDFPDKPHTVGTFPNTNIKEAPSILASQLETGAAQVGIPDEALEQVNTGNAHAISGDG